MKEHRYWVYIVSSNSGTLYIVVTDNLTRRILEHKSGRIEGFAGKYHCHRLMYYESLDNILEAISREKQLKGWRRSKKIALTESINPRWQGLAEHTGQGMAFPGESIKGLRNSLGQLGGSDAAGVFRLGRAPSLNMTVVSST